MSIFDLPRSTRLPRLRAVTDRDILDKARRYEQALTAWDRKAGGFLSVTTALQAASDDLFRVTNAAQGDRRSLPPDEAEELAAVLAAIARLDRHLFPLG